MWVQVFPCFPMWVRVFNLHFFDKMKSCRHKRYRYLILSWFRAGGGDLIGRRRGFQPPEKVHQNCKSRDRQAVENLRFLRVLRTRDRIARASRLLPNRKPGPGRVHPKTRTPRRDGRSPRWPAPGRQSPPRSPPHSEACGAPRSSGHPSAACVSPRRTSPCSGGP